MSEKKLKRLEHTYTRQDWNDQNAGLVQFTATPEGRKALWWLLGECGTFENPFDPDPHITAYAAGRQFDNAIKMATKAIDLLRRHDREKLADEILSRLRLFKNRQPYRANERAE